MVSIILAHLWKCQSCRGQGGRGLVTTRTRGMRALEYAVVRRRCQCYARQESVADAQRHVRTVHHIVGGLLEERQLGERERGSSDSWCVVTWGAGYMAPNGMRLGCMLFWHPQVAGSRYVQRLGVPRNNTYFGFEGISLAVGVHGVPPFW